MNILQEVVTPAEKIAKELAEIYDTKGAKAAHLRFEMIIEAKQLGVFERAAIGQIASAMLAGKKWKK